MNIEVDWALFTKLYWKEVASAMGWARIERVGRLVYGDLWQGPLHPVIVESFLKVMEPKA